MAKQFKIEVIIGAKEKASRVFKDVGKSMRSLGKISAVAGAATAAALAGVGTAIAKLAIDAAPLANVKRAFEGLSASVEGGSDAMLAALREASGGMVDNISLMKSFNRAATLVNQDFAQRLPSAMQYLSKVSAATGEGMDYMLNSLVVGVGRLSPLILDNLGIQVSLAEANETYAASIGKTVEQLSKEEQQAALMEHVLLKLGKATANMPDVTDSAAASLASLGALFKNVKTDIGLAFVPALNSLLGPLGELAEGVGKRVVGWAERMGAVLGESLPYAVEALREMLGGRFERGLSNARAALNLVFGERVAMLFDKWARRIADAVSFVTEDLIPDIQSVMRGFAEEGLFVGLENLADVLGIELPDKLWDFLDAAINVKDKVLEAFSAISDWAIEHWPEWRDTIVGVAGEVRAWFEENWPDWRDKVIGAVAKIRDWFEENWPVIQAVALTAWEVIGDVISSVVDTIAGSVLPKLRGAFDSLTESLETLGVDWPALWEAIKTAVAVIAPVIGAIILGLIGTITGIVTAIANVAEHISGVLASISATFRLALESIARLVGGAMATIKGIFTGDTDLIRAGWEAWIEGLKGLAEAFLQGLVNAFEGTFGTIRELVAGFVEGFTGFFGNLYDKLVGGSIVTDMMEKMKGIFGGGIEEIGNIFGGISEIVGFLSDPFGKLSALIGEQLMPLLTQMIETVAELLTDAVARAVEAMLEFIDVLIESEERSERLREALRDLVRQLSSKLVPAVKATYPLLSELARRVNLVDIAVESLIHEVYALISALSEVRIPDALRGFSPSPFEKSLKGIAGAMKEVNALTAGPALLAPAGVGAGAAGGTYNNDNRIYLSVQVDDPRGDAIGSAIVRALVDAERARRLNTSAGGHGGL